MVEQQEAEQHSHEASLLLWEHKFSSSTSSYETQMFFQSYSEEFSSSCYLVCCCGSVITMDMAWLLSPKSFRLQIRRSDRTATMLTSVTTCKPIHALPNKPMRWNAILQYIAFACISQDSMHRWPHTSASCHLLISIIHINPVGCLLMWSSGSTL